MLVGVCRRWLAPKLRVSLPLLLLCISPFANLCKIEPQPCVCVYVYVCGQFYYVDSNHSILHSDSVHENFLMHWENGQDRINYIKINYEQIFF
jgi:hypothetical protein